MKKTKVAKEPESAFDMKLGAIFKWRMQNNVKRLPIAKYRYAKWPSFDAFDIYWFISLGLTLTSFL